MVLDRRLNEIAFQVGVEARHLHGVSGGMQNLIYENTREGTVLRLSTRKRRIKEELIAEQVWLESLNAHGVRVNIPKCFEDGGMVKEISVDQEDFLVTQFEKIPGEVLDPSLPSHWNPEVFEEWGRQTGKLHQFGKTVRLDKFHQKVLKRKGLDRLYRALNERDQWIAEGYKKLISGIEKLPKDDTCYGLVHRDLHHGNIMVLDGGLHIIDTDDFGYSWFAEDIATALYHVNWHGKSVHPEWEGLHMDFLAAFAKGYAGEVPLTDVVMEGIPIFLRKREFFLYNLFHEIWDLQNLEDWQSYTLKQLEDNLKNEKNPIQL
ncbi:hypothetical protein D3H55_11635 [Bacillus salacetis]|uniref:Aminoglycoside phosphotransferase domain-containing protein n=2 Tax=Bacillus salacetis TaxID=2315464 RepID=A0A3A1QXG4_9BACI|nr:hypothetical protein D3H55_11635 [Bacillus salacetis]